MTLLAGITTWLVLSLNLGKHYGSFKCLFQWEEEGNVSIAQTKSSENIPWFLFILLRGDNFKI